MNLLEEILSRASADQTPFQVSPITDPTRKKLSLIERLTGQRMQSPPISPFPNVQASPLVPGAAISPTPPITAPPMAAQAGLLAPGIGGLGNMDAATTGAPTSPLDPNYAEPSSRVASPSRVPMPAEGPHREADGTVSPEPAAPPTDLTSRQRGPAAEEEAADGVTPGRPAQGPRMAQPDLWGGAGAFGNKIMQGLKDNSATLLALGAGFAGAPNIGQGISRAAQYAIPATQQDLKNRMSLQNQSATYQALIGAGVPQQQAIAAIGNPELQKRLLDSYIKDQKREVKEVKTRDFLGNETTKLYSINPYDPNDVKEVTPNAGGPGTGGPGAKGIGGGGTGANFFFAPGVTADSFDHTKVGEDYLNQYSPEVQAGVKNYLAGNALPTGRQALAQAIKFAATKYGNDIGMPADDAAILQRKEWSRSLGDTKSGVGLQSKGFHQGLGHFESISDELVAAHKSNALGLEPVARLVNRAKSLTTKQQNILHNIDMHGGALAREMGNLFSKNGGGVHEAAQVKEALADPYMSGESAAGSLEGVLRLMESGLRSLEERRDQLFTSGNAPRGSEFMGEKEQRQIDHIKANIARLKGMNPKPEAATAAPAAPAAAPVAARPPGRYAWDPATNTMKPLQ